MPSMRWHICTAAIAAVVIFAGCGGTSPSGSSSGSPARGSGDNVLSLAYASEWPDLDPAVAYSAEPDVLAQIYETLTYYDPEDGEIKPSLATSWESNDDGTEWTFHLREGVKFHDGTEFDSEAVKTGLERTKRIGKGASFLLDAIERIDTPDPLTAVLHLSQPRPMDLILGAGWGGYIVSPKSAAHKSGWYQAGRGAGTGPYRWESYKPNQSAVITRFDDYWGGWEDGQLTKVVYNFTPDPATREQAVLSGEAQLTYNVPLQSLSGLEGRDDVQVNQLDVSGIQYMLFNTRRPPLDDVRVRQAIVHSFPIDEIVDKVYGDVAEKNTTGLVPTGMWGHSDDIPANTYDLDKARELLKEAGHPDGGFTLSFQYIPTYPESAQIAQLWKASLEKLGIGLEARQLSFNASLETLTDPDRAPHASMRFWPPNYASPDDYLVATFGAQRTNSGVPFYGNKEVDKLLAQGLTASASDRDKAAEFYIEAQRKIMAEAPGFTIGDKRVPQVASSRLSGFTSRAFTSTGWLYALRMK